MKIFNKFSKTVCITRIVYCIGSECIDILAVQTLHMNFQRALAIKLKSNKLKLFPPRAIGYSRTRESFKSKLGVAFDAFSAVETASEMSLILLLNPQRMSRLIAHKSLNKNQLGLDELIDELIAKTINISHKDTYYQELQNVINVKVLEQLF